MIDCAVRRRDTAEVALMETQFDEGGLENWIDTRDRARPWSSDEQAKSRRNRSRCRLQGLERTTEPNAMRISGLDNLLQRCALACVSHVGTRRPGTLRLWAAKTPEGAPALAIGLQHFGGSKSCPWPAARARARGSLDPCPETV